MTWRTALRSSLAFALTLLLPSVASAARVVIIKNANRATYDDPARHLAQILRKQYEVSVVTLEGLDMAASKRLARRISTQHPSVTLALGDKAAYLAGHFVKGVPLVLGMTANWRALGLNRSLTAGVRNTLAPETMCSQIKMFLPKRRRIGVIYTKVSKSYVERAMRKAAMLGMTLLPIFVRKADEFAAAYENLTEQVQVFWLVQDPTLITTENLRQLLEGSTKAKLPTVVYSSKLVQAGLLMSIEPDPAVVATQMAGMTQKIIDGTPPSSLAVVPPDKAKVTINSDKLKALGIKVDPMLLEFVDLVKTAKHRTR